MLAHLAADRARVTELEAQILQLQDRIRDLELEHHLTQKRIDTYRYPVLTLPNEITAEVFTHFLPAFPLRPPLTGVESPTLLTHICRAWREIALSTPTLWRAICLTGFPSLTSQLEIADRWLSRSRSCALSIESFYTGRDLRSGLLSRILQEAARLVDLKLEISASELYNFAARLPATVFLVRYLELYLSDPVTPLAPSALVLFRDAPQLCTVVLNDVAALYIQLPWAQLTSVSLHSVYPRDCVRVLRQTTNLLHCELLMFGEDGGDIMELTLPSLQSFTFERDDQAIIGYLDSFTLPALCTLSIGEPFLGENPIEALNRFITKSGCKLQELCIGDKIQNPRIYRQGFPSIPKIFDLSSPSMKLEEAVELKSQSDAVRPNGMKSESGDEKMDQIGCGTSEHTDFGSMIMEGVENAENFSVTQKVALEVLLPAIESDFEDTKGRQPHGRLSNATESSVTAQGLTPTPVSVKREIEEVDRAILNPSPPRKRARPTASNPDVKIKKAKELSLGSLLYRLNAIALDSYSILLPPTTKITCTREEVAKRYGGARSGGFPPTYPHMA
ncbi:hypothetical protein C8R46DRAFT_1198636 [Mycena filopes]|nr:hypothetical protein C8R46DRAFT_1198636 [Mycena filopes]